MKSRTIQDFKEFIKNKRVGVLGVGISNKPLIRFLHKSGADITALDKTPADKMKTKEELADLDINWVLGDDYLDSLKGFDVIFKTPVIRKDLPELLNERKRGCIVTSEMEVFMRFCPSRIIGITGSDGKTTTTTITSILLEEQGYTVHTGGNIGNPLLNEIETMKDSDFVVLELSSFQLDSIKSSPDIAVITNVTPNHLDVHRDFDEYCEAKANIFLYQDILGKLVLNHKDTQAHKYKERARGSVTWFMKENQKFSFDNKKIYISESGKMDINDIKSNQPHNLSNFCAALACTEGLVDEKTAIDVLKSFEGVKHRSEFVRSINGIDFYDSSADSSPQRAKTTLQSFIAQGRSVVLIAGGKDKNCDYEGLGQTILEAGNKVILIGENISKIKDSIQKALKNNPSYKSPIIYEAESYKDAVGKAINIAETGEAVVLSPAGTSFDSFKNFEERGKYFKKIVKELPD